LITYEPPREHCSLDAQEPGWTLSADDVQLLLEITNQLTAPSIGLGALNDAVATISGLLPFEYCVLLHERGDEIGSTTLRFEFPLSRNDYRPRAPRCTKSGAIAGYLRSFRRMESLQNAFRWRTAAGEVTGEDPATVEFIARCGLRQGIAGIAGSTDDCTARIATLMQLQYSPEYFDQRNLVFMNMIILQLHAYLIHAAAGLCSSRPQATLTDKEMEVLLWVVEGKTSWEIGKILAISERTVKFHLRNMYIKLNVSNRAQAVTIANRLGIL
jgi:LuxR family transcriptional regulator, quorum-sensing system regulator SolR